MPPEMAMGRGPVSDSTDGAAFRRRYKRAKYDVALFSSALPRSRRLLPMTKSKPAREKSSPARERIEADEPARVLCCVHVTDRAPRVLKGICHEKKMALEQRSCRTVGFGLDPGQSGARSLRPRRPAEASTQRRRPTAGQAPPPKLCAGGDRAAAAALRGYLLPNRYHRGDRLHSESRERKCFEALRNRETFQHLGQRDPKQ